MNTVLHTRDAAPCWIAAVALADVRRIYARLHPVAIIVASAYGTVLYDRALRLRTAVNVAAVTLKDRLAGCGGDPSCAVAESPAATDSRDALRARAGERPLPAGHVSRRRLYPLAWREHEMLAGDLRTMQRTLEAIEVECGGWSDVRRAIRAALRSLLALDSRLEAAARRENPTKRMVALYCGSDAI